MTDTSKATAPSRKRIPIGRWLWTLFLLAALYVLSTGPVCRVVQSFQLPPGILRMFDPLMWIAESGWGKKMKPALDWYVEGVWKARNTTGAVR